ncbi:hypothetical protein FAI40_00070 [Acetobacteraceae bacterium]|nr:hypothetical protein FAI40_00070 [Acetobacteraceae bacterium]
MNNPAFIYTPESLKNAKEDNFLISLAKTLFDKELFILSKPGVNLELIFKNFYKKNVRHIIVSSGDGTLSRILGAISQTYPENEFPKITLLPSGNTNLIAFDIGSLRRDAAYLLDIVNKNITQVSVFRHSIALSFPGTNRSKVLGMFGGAGSYEKAINSSRGKMEDLAPHRLAILGILLKGSFQVIFTKKERSIWYRGVRMPWLNKPYDAFSKEIFFTLVTSLHKLPYHLWPFWNDCSGKIGFHFLRVSSFPKSFPKALLTLLISLITRNILPWIKENQDYQSGQTSEVLAELHAPFILDGEFYPPSKSGFVKLELGPQFEFLV